MKGIFLDIETNGLDPYIHSPLEICVVICDLLNMNRITEYTSLINCSEKNWILKSDPKALRINGITTKEVFNAKTTDQVCDELKKIFIENKIDKTNSIFICQNPSFDRAFFDQIMSVEIQQQLELPYHWLDLASMFFTINFPKYNYLSSHYTLCKDFIGITLGIPPEETPHRATGGVNHLISCYSGLLDNYRKPMKRIMILFLLVIIIIILLLVNMM